MTRFRRTLVALTPRLARGRRRDLTRGLTRGLTLGLALALGLSGCGLELRDVPMPKLVSGPTYTVDAVFANALNLPEQAPVKLRGDTVGEVDSIRVDDYRARVTLRLDDSVALTRGTRAGIRLTSAMGEAFVELMPPARPGPRLGPGAVLGVRSTSTAPDTTDLLSALSVVVTGGTYADLQVVVSELRTALEGNTDEVRSLLHRLDRLVTHLNERTTTIDGVLDDMDRLAASLARDSRTMSRAVEELSPAVRALSDQRESAMELLREVTALSHAGTRVVNATKDEIVAQLEAVEPILDTVVRHQEALVPTLTGVRAFAKQLDSATPGDFANFQLTTLLDVTVNGGAPFLDLEKGEPPALDPPHFPPPRLPGPLDSRDLSADRLPRRLLGGTP